MVIMKGCLLELPSLSYPHSQIISMNVKSSTPVGLLVVACVLISGILGGCSGLIEKKMAGFAGDFSSAVRNNNDPGVVGAALPGYLLMMDALVAQSPESPAIWQAAATLNSVYAGSFVMEPDRAQRLTEKAMQYGFKSLCLYRQALCEPRSLASDELEKQLGGIGRDGVDVLYTAASAWAAWIQTHGDDWSAVADLSRVEALMRRVVVLDPDYEKGMPHVYLGVLATVLPPALGGRPEEGRTHFEKALVLSGGANLMAKVMYAKQYARGVFDRELHDRLLNEVVAAKPDIPGFALSNRLAQREADALLKSADDYF